MNAKFGALMVSALMLVAIVPAVGVASNTGTQVAPVVRAGAYEDAQENYLLARAALIQVYSGWLSASAGFLRARVKWRGNRSDQNLAGLVQAGKTATLKACDSIIQYCEMLSFRVEATRGLSDNEKTQLNDEIGSYVSELQAKRVIVQNAEDAQQLRTAAGDLWQYWLQIRLRLKQITAQLMVAYANSVVQRLEAFAGRIGARIQQLKDNGIDTTALDNWLNDFNSKLDNAEQKISDAENRVSQITDNVTFIDIYRIATIRVIEGIAYLKDALIRLRDIVSDMNSKGYTVTLTGSGALIAHGSGSAYLSGTGLVWVKAIENGTMIVSPNANVTTNGVGTKENLENGYVEYQGIGSARVTGTDITVTLSGNNIILYADGTGTVTLTGTGTYRTYGENRYANGDWTSVGTTANLATGDASTG
jgi:hypothetical protein